MDQENTGSDVIPSSAEHTAKIRPSKKRLWGRRVLVCAYLLPVVLIVAVLLIQLSIKAVSSGKGFWHTHDIHGQHVGLVFGCDDRFEDRENLYFKFRMEAAAKLWHSGKLRGIIVSGDNRTHDYNEPDKMRRALVKLGVPDDKIVADYAGLRTLDSVVRCKKIFGINDVLMISQQFQNERALYIARANDMNAIAFHASDVSISGGLKTKTREWGARVKMWIDIYISDTQPRHLGPQETLPF